MIAAENASEIDILFPKYGIFTKILLQYGLDLFNPSSMGSVSSVSRMHCCEPIIAELFVRQLSILNTK